MIQLHRFMIAVVRVTVNHDGRGAPDPLVWDQGGGKKARRTHIRVNIDLASLPGGADSASWPLVFSANLLPFLELCTGRWVLRTWAISRGSFLELLILFRAVGWTSVAQ